MNTKKVALLAVASLPLLALAAPAGAASRHARERAADDEAGAYIGFAFGQADYREEGLSDITPNVGMFRFGATFNENLAVEGRVGGGLFKGTSNGYGVRVPSFAAAYVKGSLPLARSFAIYGLGGVAGANIERDYGPVYSARDNSVSFGVGADFTLRRGTVLNAEWVRLLNGDNAQYGYTLDLATIGFAWHF